MSAIDVSPLAVLDPTVGPHEDIGNFPNCPNSIPNENLGLKKKNEQNFFCKCLWSKKSLLVLEN